MTMEFTKHTPMDRGSAQLAAQPLEIAHTSATILGVSVRYYTADFCLEVLGETLGLHGRARIFFNYD